MIEIALRDIAGDDPTRALEAGQLLLGGERIELLCDQLNIPESEIEGLARYVFAEDFGVRRRAASRKAISKLISMTEKKKKGDRHRKLSI